MSSGTKRQSFQELLTVTRPWKGRLQLAVAASIVSMSFGLLFPWLMGSMVDAAIPSIKAVPHIGWQGNINSIALVLVATLAAQSLLTFFSSWTFNFIGENAVVSLRRRLYGQILSLPMKFFGEHRVGELTSRLSNDLAIIQDLLCHTVPQAIRQTMLMFGGVVAIFLTSPKLATIMLGSFPVLIALAVLFGRSVRRVSRAAQDRLAEASTVVEETLQGIASVKAFANEDFERERYHSALESFLATVLRGARYRAALIGFIILGIFGSIVLVLWMGAHMMHSGQLTHGELSRFVLYAMFVGGGVSSFAEVFSVVQKSVGATDRIRELLKEEVETTHGQSALRLQGSVRFDDVHFCYPSRPDLPVLHGINLEAKPGERIALVGPSGAGKSTLVSLLLRLYEPDSGSIHFDNKPSQDLSLSCIRNNMALVPQEVLLFGGSIFDNIAYGKPGATEAEVKDAARQANCAEFIERFPESYATLVGERGVKLSGGQRQRIAIARAFLRNPGILLLDEATSSLDSESEQLIQQALDTLLAGRTAFIIAHRLSTIRKCDRIYVVESGRITESGTHDELLQSDGGTYRRLAEIQFST